LNHPFSANDHAELIAASETEPVSARPNDARFAAPHHLNGLPLPHAHFFQPPHMLGASHQLVNPGGLPGREAIQWNQVFQVSSIDQSSYHLDNKLRSTRYSC
jgi:hypothetical protein